MIPQPKAPGSSHGRRAVLFLLAFSLALYISATGYDFVGDDLVLLKGNPYVQSFRYIGEIFTGSFWSFLGARGESIYYRPLVMLSLLVERVSFGPRPAVFHLANILLNALVVVLVYRLGRRLWPEGSGALWAGLLFAALPVHSENVAAVSGISDLECAVFFLLAMLVYARPLSSQGCIGRLPRWVPWMAAGMFLLAVLSKEAALALPVLVVFYEHFLRPGNLARLKERLERYTPMLLLVVLYLAFRLGVVRLPLKLATVRSLNWSMTVTSVLSQLGNYVFKLLWPLHLTYSWQFHPPESWRDPAVLFGALVMLLATAASARFWQRDRTVAFAIVWFLLTLGPVLNFGGLGVEAYGERYLYLPSVAFCLLAGEGLAKLAEPTAQNFTTQVARPPAPAGRGSWPWWVWLTGRRPVPHRMRQRFVRALLAILVSLATVRTAVRLPAWKNNFTLAKATLKEDPTAARFHMLLGNIYRARGERDLARSEYVQAIALDPSMAIAYVNMAGLLGEDGRAAAASDFLRRAVEVNPNLAEGFYESGRVELWQHHPERAHELFARAVALNPNYFDALYALGVMAFEAGKLEEAQELSARALRANPSSVDAHLNLGAILVHRNDPARAEAEFRRALELAPGSELPYLSLAGLYEVQGKPSAALALYRRAAQIQPHSGNAQFRLGVLALKMGNVGEAVGALENAVAIQPNSALAHSQLGLAYRAAQRLTDARRELEIALRLKPQNKAARHP
jgi:tetratricopeptide (TPR) repeat protein